MKAHVILYSRPGCHLCDELKAEILSAGCDELFTLEEINIDEDPVLQGRYKYDIPVVVINGVDTFMHRVSADEFVSAVKAASERN